ncbi:MAG: ParB/RepB/Spo0J family partition protein [Firmicutes bacterium]|nr:ParB/RepB/Spo0J family partition protein [Bacillota bacterium]
MRKTRGLGKGLGALIPELEEVESEGRLEVPIAQIRPNPYQPRRDFDPEKLAELAASIKEHGVLQPILLRRVEDGYQVVAGERRLRAAEQAGLTKIPAVIGDFSDAVMMQVALVENLQRADLNPLEEAEAYRRLMEEFGLTQEEIAQKLGKSRSAVANTLRLLHLPAPIQEDLRAGRASEGHARAILGLSDEAEQLAAWREVVEGRLSVRATEELVKVKAAARRRSDVSRETNPPRRSGEEKIGPFLQEIEDRIRSVLGTKVKIRPAGKGGRIEIEYYSPEELERILELITG